MFLARRSVASVRQLLRQQPRRFDSHAAHEDHHHHHHHAEPVSEGFGPSFYVSVSTFAAGFILYRIDKSAKESGSESWISSLIAKFQPDGRIFEERNAIRTAAMEKAAADRHLFFGTPQIDYVEIKDPELFNVRTPINVPAGSQADLSAIAAHYHKKNQEIEEKRVARMKNGKVVSIYE